MDHRRTLLDKLERLDGIDSEHYPIVTLDDYFIGNDQEDSIAPNQWGYGRPSIREIYSRLKEIEARPDCARRVCWPPSRLGYSLGR